MEQPGPTVQEIEKLNELIEIFRSGRENVSALLTNCETEVDKLGENECLEQSNIEFKLSKEEINLNLNENKSTETIVKNDNQALRIPQEISVVSIQSIESLGNNDMSVLSVTFTQSEKTLNQPDDEDENKDKLNKIESKNSLSKNNILFFLPKKSTENLEKLEKNDEPKKFEISSELSLSCSKNLNSIVDNYNTFGFNLFQHLFHEKS
jgi:Uri superfamily endonuclease